MKGLFAAFLLIGVCGAALAGIPQSASEVIMRIDGKPVYKEAFEVFCRKNAGKDSLKVSKEYLWRAFLTSRLKEADAARRGLDTLPMFKQEYKVLCGRLLKSLAVNKGKSDSVLYNRYLPAIQSLSSREMVRIQQVFIPLSPRASARETEAAGKRLDSVYHALQTGTPFEQVENKSAADSSVWIPVIALLDEIAKQVENLSAGEFSPPFFSPEGGHIVRLLERHKGWNYEQCKPYVAAYLHRRGEDSLLLASDGKHVTDARISLQNPVVSRTQDAVRSDLLVSRWNALYADSFRINPTPSELQKFFEKKRKNYRWVYPHYKGAVILCENKKMSVRIRKRLKKVDMTQWASVLNRLMREDSTLHARMTVGLFRIGQNPYIDRLAFKCGTLPHEESFPYVFLLGKKLKKGPENYTDVRSAVEADFRIEKEALLMLPLESRLGVEINQEVLKSVNFIDK